MKDIVQLFNEAFESNYPQYKGQGIASDGAIKFKNILEEIKGYMRSNIPKNLEIKVSIGQGRFTSIPWIGIWHREDKSPPQSGIYIAYAFSGNGKTIYAALTQGTTKSSIDKLIEVRNNIQNDVDARQFAKNTGKLHVEGDKRNYSDATIFYKEYKADNLPSEDTIKNNLQTLIEIYEECNDKGFFNNTNNVDSKVKNQDFSNSVNGEIKKKLVNNIYFSLAPFIKSTHANTSFATRYVASLLAKPFVILTGNSGTGKTRIARQLAKWLEKSSANEKNWLLVPVGADWTDNTKILGYYNPLANGGAGEYVESEILRLIERANANPALPFFLILDEMNLSHVERYFSDFLSKMETPGDPFEIDHYGTLRFPENLFITGTVNIDETTYMFSPKVLDRANVIEFKPTVDELFGDAAGSSSGEVVTTEDGMAEAFMHLASKVRKDNSPLGQELTDSLKEIYGILDGYGFEFAFRTVNEIRLYMAAARELGTEETALDEQVLQKILPKIHGNRKQIGEMLDRLEEKCGSLKLAASAEKIVWMKSRLERFQYASFV